MVTAALSVEQLGALRARRLHDYDPAHGLTPLIGLVNEQVGKGPEKLPSAELQDGFGKIVHSFATRDKITRISRSSSYANIRMSGSCFFVLFVVISLL
jgi:hypothetical protein